MHVSRLELTDFRNYERLEFNPGTGLNVLVGPNAQGKTNVLEALYALATTKSHRTSRDTELVRFGAPLARVSAEVQKLGDIEYDLELAIGAGGIGTSGKLVKLGGSKQPRLTDLLGHLNAVLFASTDLDIVRGEPDERRRFLNYEISQLSPRYALALASYRKALEGRNRLLKDFKHGHGDVASLEAWTVPVIEHGSKLIERRQAWLERLTALAAPIHQSLTAGLETLEVVYQASFPLLSESVVDDFAAALKNARREETARGVTTLGPQRDDLTFRIGPPGGLLLDARTYGSQGQQRTVALALRLAERQLIEETVGEPPIVLLDDVLSDLDESRRNQIFALSLTGGGQTFLTTTDLSPIPLDAVRNARVVTVRQGIFRDA
ncbi:DNA replication/repair protein RecF [Armatimonas sp.]|uniref:DNA replication/repair protein RecF n=1 Tax=Armatimonas sp. TaxID=1872638 RepID=UPI00286AE815|nr:DNA replication/repair protein RecF [Armatimonas sp.]